MKKINLVGKKFGRWTVIKRVENNGRSKFLCKCECGVKKEVIGNNLVRGISNSCGCLSREITSKMSFKHGLADKRINRIYRNINTRCNNINSPDYKNYGGRGIKNEWTNFQSFLDDMHKSYLEHVDKYGKMNTSIDRIDNNGNYCKNNCRWATRKEQANNTRISVTIEYKGKAMNISDWARHLNIEVGTLCARLGKLNWDIERAFAEKVFLGKNQTYKKSTGKTSA